jgi:hypothetical protein
MEARKNILRGKSSQQPAAVVAKWSAILFLNRIALSSPSLLSMTSLPAALSVTIACASLVVTCLATSCSNPAYLMAAILNTDTNILTDTNTCSLINAKTLVVA